MNEARGAFECVELYAGLLLRAGAKEQEEDDEEEKEGGR